MNCMIYGCLEVEVVLVNPACTTQACSIRGFIPERKITEYRCENFVIDRDNNAK